MHSTNKAAYFQSSLCSSGFICLPSNLEGFVQTMSSTAVSRSGKNVHQIYGFVEHSGDERICPVCGRKMHVKSTKSTVLRHLHFGPNYTDIIVEQHRFYCPDCHHSHMEPIPFMSEHHRITKPLENYIEGLLTPGDMTLKQIAELAGVNEHLVKEIDKRRLQREYVVDNHLKIPSEYSRFLAIDEFKLHNGHQYATHIIDLETGHVLWIARGKKKQVVYDFIDTVGMDWMDHVEAVACDMNSDFQEAFEERCEWITIVFDHFHIVKNFNDKVISEIRKDEQRRLKEEGLDEEAKKLKKTKYILTSSRKTLKKKDKRGEEGAVIRAENTLFGLQAVVAKTGHTKRYNELIHENKLLFACDLVKSLLDYAYSCSDEIEMADTICEIIDLCKGTKNKHLEWFAKLLLNHFDGIIAHGTYRISSGKIEGINGKIKTLRRHSFGFRDDSYFFLRIMDASRHKRPRNQKSHKVLH